MAIHNYQKLKSTPGMWVLYFLYLAILVGVTIFAFNIIATQSSGDRLPTKVFTVEKDVISLKLPEDWYAEEMVSTKAINFKSNNGYESLSISTVKESDVSEASIMYMLELKNMFPNVSTNFQYNESKINGKTLFATQIMYESKYYLCGVMESGNTIIRFVYSASVTAAEISDIDTIIGSINYRKGASKYE
jgi:hypothetical protein